MTRDQLEHAIRAACDVSKDTELWIFGSQAILGEFPNAPESLRASIEVDVQPKNRPETVVCVINLRLVNNQDDPYVFNYWFRLIDASICCAAAEADTQLVICV